MPEPITITTTRQLDALVAEKIFERTYDDALPAYSTDWIAADGVACYSDLTIVYSLKNKAILVSPPLGMGHSEKVGFCPDEVRASLSGDDWITILRRKAKAIEMNIAICLVALSTVGVEVDLQLEGGAQQSVNRVSAVVSKP